MVLDGISNHLSAGNTVTAQMRRRMVGEADRTTGNTHGRNVQQHPRYDGAMICLESALAYIATVQAPARPAMSDIVDVKRQRRKPNTRNYQNRRKKKRGGD